MHSHNGPPPFWGQITHWLTEFTGNYRPGLKGLCNCFVSCRLSEINAQRRSALLLLRLALPQAALPFLGFYPKILGLFIKPRVLGVFMKTLGFSRFFKILGFFLWIFRNVKKPKFFNVFSGLREK